jgi:hypothetical protein
VEVAMILQPCKIITFLGLAVLTMSISACSCKPIVYKPTADPSPIILSLKMPDAITSLSLFPRDRTSVEKGVNKNSGGRQPDEIEEMFYIFKGSDGSSMFFGTEYRITLYRNEDAAKRGYEFWRKGAAPLGSPPFHEDRQDNWAYYLAYINQPRSSVEGFCRPMPYYRSEIIFRLRNLVASIVAHHEDMSSDLLVSSVKYFAEQLEKAMESNGEYHLKAED